MSLMFVTTKERRKLNRLKSYAGLLIHDFIYFNYENFTNMVRDKYKPEWEYFAVNCMGTLDSKLNLQKSHFYFLLMRIGAGNNCILSIVQVIFINCFDYVEKAEERRFITERLEDMLFYAVKDLPAKKKAPAKSAFKLALEYGFKNTAKKIFVNRPDFLLFFLCEDGDDDMVSWLLWWSQETLNGLIYQWHNCTTVFHIAAEKGEITILKMLKAAASSGIYTNL